MSMRMQGQINENKKSDGQVLKIAGLMFIVVGLAFGLDQLLTTGWLALVVFPIVGMIGCIIGIRLANHSLSILGALMTGLGAGGFFLLSPLIDLSLITRIGCFFCLFGLGWIGVLIASVWIGNSPALWAMVPGLLFVAAGLPFILGNVRFLVFVFYICCALGLAFIFWGGIARLFGLIIPGALLLGIGPGIYFAWNNVNEPNGLVETGIMLVWFALGWGLITIGSRVVTEKFVWWPLIPGGILAVVGWGLYIGGDPDNALAFISNTGSIGLLLLGIYLLFLRRGFKE